MQNKPTTEEKFWAVISYLAIFMAGTGMVMPAFAWAEHHKKSKYIAFHALQVIGIQSLGYTLWGLLATFVLLILTIATLPLLKQGESLTLWINFHIYVTAGLYGLYLLIPVIGVIQCILGRDFYAPFLGKRLARLIGYHPAAQQDSPLNEANEERFAASMAHFAVIYPLSGMLPSLIFLLLPGARSRYMQFQSLQTIIFQAISTVVTLGLGALSFIVLLIAIFPIITNPAMYQPTLENLTPVFIFLLCLIVVVLIVPLYQIVGQWAGLQILRGREYRYPFIARRVEHWLAKREQGKS